ncbi:MAG: Na+/H+ antiporter subunit E [bacterium]|nr:Na+/H+ antiporter subunit E [bacterium]
MKEINSLSKNLTGFLFLFIIFIMLTFPFNIQEAIAGAFAALLVSLFFNRMFAFYSFREPLLFSLFNLFAYLFFLLFEILKANIQVAKIVLSPKVNITPAIVSCETTLKSDFAKSILANSITLTPGTLTMDIIGEKVYVHCIDIKDTSRENVYKSIVKPFEDKIKRFAI